MNNIICRYIDFQDYDDFDFLLQYFIINVILLIHKGLQLFQVI